MLTTKLTKSERRIIRKIARIQLASLKSIITGECSEDLLHYCLDNDISQTELVSTARVNHGIFENLIKNPTHFIAMDEDNTSVTKHILHSYFNRRVYSVPKQKIWRKLNIKENFLFNLN